MTYVVNNRRTCIGGNVFMDSENSQYQTDVSNFLKENFNIDVFRTTTTEGNDTHINNFMYPFDTYEAAMTFVKEVLLDPHSIYYTNVGYSIADWYRAQPYTYEVNRFIIEVANTESVTDSLTSGDYTVAYEFLPRQG